MGAESNLLPHATLCGGHLSLASFLDQGPHAFTPPFD